MDSVYSDWAHCVNRAILPCVFALDSRGSRQSNSWHRSLIEHCRRTIWASILHLLLESGAAILLHFPGDCASGPTLLVLAEDVATRVTHSDTTHLRVPPWFCRSICSGCSWRMTSRL